MRTLVSEFTIVSLLLLSFHATAATLYVDLNSTNPVLPVHRLEHGSDKHSRCRGRFDEW